MTGKLLPITGHKAYVPSKVRAELFYGIDPNLDENSKSLYEFLLKVCQQFHSIRYCKWSTMEDAVHEVSNSEFARDLPLYAVRNSFTNLRKNRYLRHTFNRDLDARILELLEFIGENARD